MGLRILRQPGLIKVAKPGFDAATAAEKDLLLSLNARNAQIIQRGFLAAPAPTNVAAGFGTYTYDISFPAQASVPDVWCTILTRNGSSSDLNDSQSLLANTAPTMRTTWAASSCRVVFRGSTGSDAGSPSYAGLQYLVFRKRLNS